MAFGQNFFNNLSEPDQVSEESGEYFGVVSAAFLAAKGRTKQLDLLPTECGDKRYLAFLTVGWGMIRCACASVVRTKYASMYLSLRAN